MEFLDGRWGINWYTELTGNTDNSQRIPPEHKKISRRTSLHLTTFTPELERKQDCLFTTLDSTRLFQLKKKSTFQTFPTIPVLLWNTQNNSMFCMANLGKIIPKVLKTTKTR